MKDLTILESFMYGTLVTIGIISPAIIFGLTIVLIFVIEPWIEKHITGENKSGYFMCGMVFLVMVIIMSILLFIASRL